MVSSSCTERGGAAWSPQSLTASFRHDDDYLISFKVTDTISGHSCFLKKGSKSCLLPHSDRIVFKSCQTRANLMQLLEFILQLSADFTAFFYGRSDLICLKRFRIT